MNLRLIITTEAEKQFSCFPKGDRVRLFTALREMAENPFSGNVRKLHGAKTIWRRRVGAYRILYELSSNSVFVYRIERRTSNTY